MNNDKLEELMNMFCSYILNVCLLNECLRKSFIVEKIQKILKYTENKFNLPLNLLDVIWYKIQVKFNGLIETLS